MQQKKFSHWLAVEDGKAIRFSDLAHLVAKALHPDDDNAYAGARVNLDSQLLDAVRDGQLVVRNSLDMGQQSFPRGDALMRSVLLPQDLRPFVEARGIELRITPHGSGPEYWTLANAAEAIAEQERWHGGARATLHDQLVDAANAGELPVLDPHTCLRCRPARVREFYELVTPSAVNAWLESQSAPYRWNPSSDSLNGQDVEVEYDLVMFARLEPKTPWKGGRMAPTDLLPLEEAVKLASRHAGYEVSKGDFLRAGARGEIHIKAVSPRTVTMIPARKSDSAVTLREGTVWQLPKSTCAMLNIRGSGAWRGIEGYASVEAFGGAPGTFLRWRLSNGEPDLVVTVADCFVIGDDVHALADAFLQTQGLSHDGDAVAEKVQALVYGVSAAPSEAAKPPAAPQAAGGTKGTGKRWTAEALAKLSEHKAKFGTKAAAKAFGISEARVRELCPSQKPQKKGFSAFTYRPK